MPLSHRSRWVAAVLSLAIPVLHAGSAVAAGTSGASGANVLQVKGSDTIGGKLGQDFAHAYMALHPEVEVRWEALGSGTAFVGLLDGSAQIGASSRSVKESEVAEARKMGVELRELVLGYDGIAVIVHPENPLSELTLAQLSDLFTGKIRNWKEVGGPDLLVHVVTRPSYSGTFSFFRDKVLRHGNDKGGEDYYANSEVIEENGGVLNKVAQERGAISYVGIGWITPQIKALGVAPKAGQPAIRASVASVRTGTYPIYRPLLLYTRGEAHGAARGLLAYILGAEGQKLVAKNDFVPSDSPVTLAPEVAAAADAAAPHPQREQRVRFTRGAVLNDAAKAALADVAVAAKAAAAGPTGPTGPAGAGRLLVVGHADATGSRAANQAMSLARARAVAQYLTQLGVQAGSIQIEGHGSDDPVSSNREARGRAANRRVDIMFLGAAAH